MSLNFLAKIESQMLGNFFPIILWRQSLWSKKGYYDAYKDGFTEKWYTIFSSFMINDDSLFRILQTIHLQNTYFAIIFLRQSSWSKNGYYDQDADEDGFTEKWFTISSSMTILYLDSPDDTSSKYISDKTKQKMVRWRLWSSRFS